MPRRNSTRGHDWAAPKYNAINLPAPGVEGRLAWMDGHIVDTGYEWTRLSREINFMDFGGRSDGRSVTDGAMTYGSYFLDSASADFTDADKNRKVAVTGVGATGTLTVTTAALTSNVATLTLSTGHALAVGDVVRVKDMSLSSAFDGQFTITAKTSTTATPPDGTNTIAYAKTNANIGSAASTGSVVGPLGKVLSSSIVTVISESRVLLADAAQMTITNAAVAIGTSNYAPLTNAIAATLDGGEIHLPEGRYGIDASILANRDLAITGAGMGRTEVYAMGDAHLFLANVGGETNLTFRNMSVFNYAGGWNGNRQLFRMSGGALRRGITLEYVELVSDVRAMLLEDCEQVRINNCRFRPLTSGICNANVSQSTTGVISTSRQIWIEDNTFEIMAPGRSTPYLVDGDATTPVNTGITGQAMINCQISRGHIKGNEIKGFPFLGILLEGQENVDIDVDGNTMEVSAGFPSSSSSSVNGILLKTTRGMHLRNNTIIGSATSQADAAGKGSVGINYTPGSDAMGTFGDLFHCHDNTVTKFKHGLHFGNSNGTNPVASFDIHNNTLRDSGLYHLFLELGTFDCTGAVGTIKHNKYELSAAASNVTTQLTPGSGLDLHVEGENFRNSNDGYTLAIGTGATLSVRGNRNNTGTKRWNTTQLLAFRGTFIAEDVIQYETTTPINLDSAAARTNEFLGEIDTFANYAFLGIDVTYTEASSADAGIDIVIKADASETLGTYTTLANQAIRTVDHFRFGSTGFTAVEIPDTRKTITFTCACNKTGTGEVMLKVLLMRN